MKKFLKSIFILLLTLCIIVSSNSFNTQAASKCLNKAQKYKKHFYKVYDYGLTWENAKKYCESMGGHLVTITSQEEQDFVRKLVTSHHRNNYWLGAQKDKNGKWKWITKEKFVYTCWATPQPDNHLDCENSLMLYRNMNPIDKNKIAEWNDLNSDGTCEKDKFFGLDNMGFICEWEKSSNAKPIDITKIKIIIIGDFRLVNGKLRIPQIKTTYCGRTLKKGVDYSIKLSYSIKTRKINLTFKGLGDFKGTKSKKYIVKLL